MLYQRTLTVPANTPETEPVSATLKLAYGASTRREIEFPDGCHGLVHVRVNEHGWQVLPWSRDEWLASEGSVIVDDSVYPLETVPYVFTLIAYNEDTANSHAITLRVQVAEGAIAAGLARFISALKRSGVI